MLIPLIPWKITPVILSNEKVSLIPITLNDYDTLHELLVTENMDNYWYTAIPNVKTLRSEIENRIALASTNDMITFVVIDKLKNQTVGMTSYTAIDKQNHRLEIGYTWYIPSAQKTHINLNCKLLLLTHAFESLQANAIEFRTHSMNFQSQNAIIKLGAKLDGVLRSHRCQVDEHGHKVLRDTHVYSILQHEWLTVKVNLKHRLQKYE